jgi:hypothetical protein
MSVEPIVINNIFILTREAAAVNSLYIDFTVNHATSTLCYLEFVFSSLDLNYFGIQNGGTIPCYISALTAATGASNGVVCFGFSDGVNSTTPLTIRVVGFASFSSGK